MNSLCTDAEMLFIGHGTTSLVASAKSLTVAQIRHSSRASLCPTRQAQSRSSNRSLRRQFLKQRLRFLQIERVEAFGEPAINRSEQFASLLRLPLITPEPRHAHRCAQLPGLGLLLTRN